MHGYIALECAGTLRSLALSCFVPYLSHSKDLFGCTPCLVGLPLAGKRKSGGFCTIYTNLPYCKWRTGPVYQSLQSGNLLQALHLALCNVRDWQNQSLRVLCPKELWAFIELLIAGDSSTESITAPLNSHILLHVMIFTSLCLREARKHRIVHRCYLGCLECRANLRKSQCNIPTRKHWNSSGAALKPQLDK